MIRSLAVSVAVLACVGCGGAKLGGGKEGAAQALASASSAALTANSFAGASGGTASYPCPHGGSIVATTDMTGTTQNASFTADYNGCSVDGHNKLDGTLTITMTAESSSTGGALIMQTVGDITISGDISDFLRANITQRMTYTTSTTPTTMSMNATIVLDGSIETSSARYDYASETYQVNTTAELPRG